MKRMIFCLFVTVAIVGDLGYTQTDKSGEAMLQGVVRSKDEGLIEGVLVSAKRVGSGVMVKEPEYTVVSDNQGRYRFPAGKLLPGKYDLGTWAVGYDSVEKSGVEVLPNKTAPVEFLVEKLQDKSKFAMQLSHTEWELTLGSPQPRRCGECHLIGRIMLQSYSPYEWEPVIFRMKNYGEGSAIRRGGIAVVPRWKVEQPLSQADIELAQYLGSVAGRDRLSGLPFKTLPRPTKAATKVILTSYDLAREDSGPHDLAVGADGVVWHGEIALPYLGKLDPRTGEARLYNLSEDLKGRGLPPGAGTTDVEIDNEGNPWFGVQSGGSIGKLDKRTGKVALFPLEEGPVNFPLREGQVSFRTAMIAAGSPDGKIWTMDGGDHPRKHVHRFDPRTGVIEHFPLPDKEKHALYGITVDSKGNAYFAGLTGNTFGKVDAKTGKITYYPPPTPDSAPRRIQADGKDRIWFAEFRGNKVAMFDPVSEQIREWPLPSPYAGAYDVAPDKNGDIVWVSGNYDDRIYKLDTRTGQFVGYAWPRPFPNVQRLSVDNSAKVPTVWIAEDNYGKATKLEVLEDTK